MTPYHNAHSWAPLIFWTPPGMLMKNVGTFHFKTILTRRNVQLWWWGFSMHNHIWHNSNSFGKASRHAVYRGCICRFANHRIMVCTQLLLCLKGLKLKWKRGGKMPWRSLVPLKGTYCIISHLIVQPLQTWIWSQSVSDFHLEQRVADIWLTDGWHFFLSAWHWCNNYIKFLVYLSFVSHLF